MALTYEERKARQRERYATDPIYRAQCSARRRRRSNNKTVVRNDNLKAKFGITTEDYQRMLAAQDGVCAICHGTSTGRWEHFHVDHDHDTGNVRGLLCHHCNTAIGLLRDSAEFAERAAFYLRKHKG